MTEVLENTVSVDSVPVTVPGEKRKRKYRGAFHPVRTLLLAVICAAAIPTVLITCFFPLLRISSGSMAPTLNEGEIVLTVKGTELGSGQLCAFYYQGNQILIKRVIAVAGDTVDIDSDGNVYVNGELLEEAYLTKKSAGKLDISLPLTVPEGEYFVLGDHRSISLDSRDSQMGCVSKENVIGKVIFRVWPLAQLGFVS